MLKGFGKVNYIAAAVSDAGRIKTVNQDNVFGKSVETNDVSLWIFAVADGLGGLTHGEVSSKIAVDIINKWCDNELHEIIKTSNKSILNLVDKSLNELFDKINNNIFQYSVELGEKSGTTLSLIVLQDVDYVIKHIGDSRIYKIDNSIEQLTLDHSWVAEQVRIGRMSLEDARISPRRNILTQCLGVTKNLDVNSCYGKLRKEQTILICSDGFYNKLDDREIISGVSKLGNNKDGFYELIQSLINTVKKRGEGDNISVILLKPQNSGIISKLKIKYK